MAVFTFTDWGIRDDLSKNWQERHRRRALFNNIGWRNDWMGWYLFFLFPLHDDFCRQQLKTSFSHLPFLERFQRTLPVVLQPMAYFATWTKPSYKTSFIHSILLTINPSKTDGFLHRLAIADLLFSCTPVIVNKPDLACGPMMAYEPISEFFS